MFYRPYMFHFHSVNTFRDTWGGQFQRPPPPKNRVSDKMFLSILLREVVVNLENKVNHNTTNWLLYWKNKIFPEYFYLFPFFLQEVHYINTTFYASPVVLVSVHHNYDSQEKSRLPPENNIIAAWVEVRYFLITRTTITYRRLGSNYYYKY